METTQPSNPSIHLTPGAILASPQGRGTIVIQHVDACVTALVDGQRWVWPRRSTERVLTSLGFRMVGSVAEVAA